MKTLSATEQLIAAMNPIFMTTEKAAGLKTVECGNCGRIVNIAPEVVSRYKELANAGHANIDRGTIQCACGRQL